MTIKFVDKEPEDTGKQNKPMAKSAPPKDAGICTERGRSVL